MKSLLYLFEKLSSFPLFKNKQVMHTNGDRPRGRRLDKLEVPDCYNDSSRLSGIQSCNGIEVFRWRRGHSVQICGRSFLSVLLSWYAMLSGLGDGLHPYVFPLAILITKGVKFTLALVYLGYLYARLSECVDNEISTPREIIC